MTKQLLWTKRTTSERFSLIIMAVGCAFLAGLAIWGQDPVESGEDFTAFLGWLTFGALFLFFTVPAALAVLVMGGAHFVSPWRRALDKALPILTLALLWLLLSMLAGLHNPLDAVSAAAPPSRVHT